MIDISYLGYIFSSRVFNGGAKDLPYASFWDEAAPSHPLCTFLPHTAQKHWGPLILRAHKGLAYMAVFVVWRQWQLRHADGEADALVQAHARLREPFGRARLHEQSSGPRLLDQSGSAGRIP